MNIKQYITFSFLFAPFFFLYGQTKRDTLSFRIVSYNVENLFDCRHDTLKNDYEFLPDAMRHWNYTKYKKKLDDGTAEVRKAFEVSIVKLEECSQSAMNP